MTTHREISALPESGAFDSAHGALKLPPGTRDLTVALWYKKHASASAAARPGFRVIFWIGNPQQPYIATGRDLAGLVSGTGITYSEYQALIDCVDLTNADATTGVRTVREIKLLSDVSAVRIEPCELGDKTKPGYLEIILGRV